MILTYYLTNRYLILLSNLREMEKNAVHIKYTKCAFNDIEIYAAQIKRVK